MALGYNALTGMLPQSWSQFSRLTKLDLEFNNLSGFFPAWPLNSSSLNTIAASGNNFSGCLPPVTGGLQQTVPSQVLYYVSNKPPLLMLCWDLAVSTKPAAVSAGRNLTIVALAANALNGSLDMVCSDNVIPNLIVLDLGLNNFTGIWAGLSVLFLTSLSLLDGCTVAVAAVAAVPCLMLMY